MGKIDEIRNRAERYRGKAAAIKAGQYTEDVDTLMARIAELEEEIVGLTDTVDDLMDTLKYCYRDWEDTDWDDDWDDENECGPLDDEPNSELSGYRCCENCGNEGCSKCAVAFNWDECVDSNFEKHWIPKPEPSEKDGE